ncbi:hypothetical protein [Streptosporangium sp. NBC_01469]|uniref:hypothetical protein n=1 Tax=Streptosporangium sp. NBC_01469 TaxID=2903898 RepID=UPI002E29A49F|nr:hypothetical protein [Streptosporangium sp. NBC_01469]
MADFPHIWIGAYSEVVRADCVTSFFVSDGQPDNRAGESNNSGVLWARVMGHHEPVRIDGFTGIAAAELLNAITQMICKAIYHSSDVSYVWLSTTSGPAPVTSVQINKSYSRVE